MGFLLNSFEKARNVPSFQAEKAVCVQKSDVTGMQVCGHEPVGQSKRAAVSFWAHSLTALNYPSRCSSRAARASDNPVVGFAAGRRNVPAVALRIFKASSAS